MTSWPATSSRNPLCSLTCCLAILRARCSSSISASATDTRSPKPNRRLPRRAPPPARTDAASLGDVDDQPASGEEVGVERRVLAQRDLEDQTAGVAHHRQCL